MPFHRPALGLTLAALALAGTLAGAAQAATTDRSPAPAAPAPAAQPAQATTPNAAAETAPAAKVTGFRSARFGMTGDEVAKAITKDFKIEGKDIRRETNATERTTSLIVKVDDLQTGAGPAVVAYILGHSTQKLFQVNILWGGAVNPKVDPNALVGAANALRNYFVAQGYRQEGMLLNAPVGDGSQVVVFRGTDSQGRMSLLTLAVPPKPSDDTPALPPSLQLSYIEKPNEPDVFKIEKGF
ncbi:hypothetical protein D3869_22555 (plasmid) [Azospirillum brasilense]|uniref:Uncharacterized protein n=1 Tax=Azospirillum brasilense TaxID=192 RepID=A0A4D8RF43_AZOBR|nr:hypothetical protein [Azospirillum brasilense]QCO18069.1 hypothetical protein D3869_22555 [Azospirillum brasilense]